MSVRTYTLAPSAVDASGTVHRPTVRQTSSGGRALHTLACSCGLVGVERTVGRLAAEDRHEHLMAVSAVPPAERCRQHKAHRLQPWDRCGLCSGQLDLFDDPAGEVAR